MRLKDLNHMEGASPKSFGWVSPLRAVLVAAVLIALYKGSIGGRTVSVFLFPRGQLTSPLESCLGDACQHISGY